MSSISQTALWKESLLIRLFSSVISTLILILKSLWATQVHWSLQGHQMRSRCADLFPKIWQKGFTTLPTYTTKLGFEKCNIIRWENREWMLSALLSSLTIMLILLSPWQGRYWLVYARKMRKVLFLTTTYQGNHNAQHRRQPCPISDGDHSISVRGKLSVTQKHHL